MAAVVPDPADGAGGSARDEAAAAPFPRPGRTGGTSLLAGAPSAAAALLRPAAAPPTRGRHRPGGGALLVGHALGEDEHGVWCDPPALIAGSGGRRQQRQDLTLRLPLALLASVQAAGHGLRVVAGVAQQPAPCLDVTVWPHEPKWPAAGAGGCGALTLTVALDTSAAVASAAAAAPPPPPPLSLLVVQVLCTPRVSVSGGAGVTRPPGLVATLCVLLLPALAASEVCALFVRMQQQWAAVVQRQAVQTHPLAAAAATFAACMMPLACDMSLLAQHAGARADGDGAGSGCGAAAGVMSPHQIAQLARRVESFLACNGMTECRRALSEAGVLVPPVCDA